MINMSIFKTILESAYDLDIFHFDSKMQKFISNPQGYGFIHRCNINTSDGGLHITLHENHFEGQKSINAEIKSSINSYSKEDVRNLIESQLQIEAFLGCDDYEQYTCECSFIN